MRLGESLLATISTACDRSVSRSWMGRSGRTLRGAAIGPRCVSRWEFRVSLLPSSAKKVTWDPCTWLTTPRISIPLSRNRISSPG